MASHTPMRLPDSMTRDDLGPYMRGLREHYALSQQDVSERLHIRHRYINAIETGAHDQMPGRAYAKGYVHTYAEFLGLDPEQAVEICFGPEPVREQQKHFVPAPAQRGGALPGQWRGVAVAGVVIALGVLAIAQFATSGDEGGVESEIVAEVPEDLLNEMRRLVMPDSRNYRCLVASTALGCLQEVREWRQMQALVEAPTYYFADRRYAGPIPHAVKKPQPAAADAAAPEAKPQPETVAEPAAPEPAPKPKPATDEAE